MRIVIDMQGAQTESRFRGIGRYTLAFAQAVVRNRGDHEIILILSGLFPDTIGPTRVAFDGLLPQENIRVWHAPGPVKEVQPGNDSRRETAELLREAFLISLQPDVIHLSSLFEGYVDDAVTGIAHFDAVTPVSLTLYDLIPLLNPDHYLKPDPQYEQYYRRKMISLNRASICLSISEFSRLEATNALGWSQELVLNVSGAVESSFQPQIVDKAEAGQLLQRIGIVRPFVLYTGGADERKNLPRLIEAYASLPASLRRRHHLLLAGKMPEGRIARFKHIAHAAGLKAGELLFTGYICDEELIQLYNLCELYIFPSWHEGFGLPALEAMACGAPVIGADASSVPEVIGMREALFNPFEITAIAGKISQALEDETFRSRLRAHGLQQAKKFSWDETANRAIRAWEALVQCSPADTGCSSRFLSYDQLLDAVAAAVEPADQANLAALCQCMALNESTGIERQLLVDVSELCERDAATGVQRVVRSYLKWLLQSPPPGYRIEPVYATRSEGYRYARRFTLRFQGRDDAQATDAPIRWQRGDLFFGLDMQHHVQLAHAAFYRRLRQEGVTVKFLVYDLLPIQLAGLFKDSSARELHERWLAMIAKTDGAVCISKATARAFDDWMREHAVPRAPTFRTDWVHIGADIAESRPSVGLPAEATAVLASLRRRPTFLCVSTIEPRKRQQQILEAAEILWLDDTDVNLVLVGQQGWKTEALALRLRGHPELGRRLFWLEGISDEYLEMVYAASACLVAASINEGFGLSLVEAARHGVPILARDIPVFREVAGDHAYYFRGETGQELAAALKAWLDLQRCNELPLSKGMPWSTWQQSTEALKAALAVRNGLRRQLLVDVSELVQRDARTGIQRVVRSILREWLGSPPDGYRVEPVYATIHQGYRYARLFAKSFLGEDEDTLPDDPVEYAPGDVFLGLDFQPQVVPAQAAFFRSLRHQGVGVKFVVYDLLCLHLPQCFPSESSDGIKRWLETIGENDGAICISRTVADELTAWVIEHCPDRQGRFEIDSFLLGADVGGSVPTTGLPPDASKVIACLNERETFLMVGTLEPRKAHAQVLDALETLWLDQVDVNLVIVGKVGWMVDEVIGRIRKHAELGHRLFWLEGVSDEYLERIYASSDCLIAASLGEGFGLPLIEAAQHTLPIIARDIPVFREVASDHACFFDGNEPGALARELKAWLVLYRSNRHPNSDKIRCATWRESARELADLAVAPRRRPPSNVVGIRREASVA